MSQATTLEKQEGFGSTARQDAWWIGPVLTLLGLSAFLIYGTWAAWQDGNFEIRKERGGHEAFHKPTTKDSMANKAIAPYLSPFYSPLIYDSISEHAWIKSDLKTRL